jgi:hypothetical protein
MLLKRKLNRNTAGWILNFYLLFILNFGLRESLGSPEDYVDDGMLSFLVSQRDLANSKLMKLEPLKTIAVPTSF